MANAINGFDEACAQERHERNSAYLDLPAGVCGVVIRQMTPMDLARLTVAKNPYLTGSGAISHPVAAQFVFHLAASPITIESALACVAAFEIDELDNQIAQYLDVTFRDQASSGGMAPGAPVASLVAWLEYRMAGTPWGWNRDRTMGTPLRVIWQQIRCWLSEKGEPVINQLSGKKTGKFLRDLEEEHKGDSSITKKINEIWLRGQFGDAAVDAMNAREDTEKPSPEPVRANPIYSTLTGEYNLK